MPVPRTGFVMNNLVAVAGFENNHNELAGRLWTATVNCAAGDAVIRCANVAETPGAAAGSMGLSHSVHDASIWNLRVCPRTPPAAR
jgi:hypothetical protein